jgi:hypothetical protein
MKRQTRTGRRPPRRPITRVRVALIVTAALTAAGFIYFSLVAAYNQHYFSADYAHPWDYIADGCLAVAFCAVGAMLLVDSELVPRRLRRLTSGRRWRAAMRARGRG